MKNTICFSTLLLLLVGCAPRYALKGTYRETPYVIPTTKSTEETWLQVLDFLVQEKITPQLVKKKKSLIVTDIVPLKDFSTMEDSRGKLLDSTQYIVLPEIKKAGMYLKSASAHWTIKVHSHKNKTAVVVELSKVTATYDSNEDITKLIGDKVSTGAFERKMQAFLQK